jgi:hypothetical protein
MRRTLTLILGVALFGILAAVVVASQGADDPAGSEAATVTETVEHTTTVEDNPKPRDRKADDTGVDISGPCDEAEHANDPRCGGQGQAPATQAPAQGGVDISGPCDEAEHANDPRCTGAPTGRVDNSGPGSVNSGRDDDVDDDHGGEDRSGPGRGGDDGGDDHSGSGGGGDDD